MVEMETNNFGPNLSVLADMINELYVKTTQLDRKGATPVYESIPDLKKLGGLLIS